MVGAEARFEPQRMETVDLNGRRVLVVEGNCIEEQVKGLFIFINASGDGYLADQMLFLAPENTFEQYLPSVQSAITSIEWVPSVPMTMPEISELEKFTLEEASQFGDPATFPPKESVYRVMTLPDGSFEAYIRKGPPMFSQSKIHCPKKTKLHEYIASFKDQILS